MSPISRISFRSANASSTIAICARPLSSVLYERSFGENPHSDMLDITSRARTKSSQRISASIVVFKTTTSGLTLRARIRSKARFTPTALRTLPYALIRIEYERTPGASPCDSISVKICRTVASLRSSPATFAASAHIFSSGSTHIAPYTLRRVHMRESIAANNSQRRTSPRPLAMSAYVLSRTDTYSSSITRSNRSALRQSPSLIAPRSAACTIEY
mmetsp:Transcript_5332/g.14279  ORF Transcript_5332/g.14279 Transcript_5332/m.14279 type:complete len:216 (+) Transcript_5332:229-876(+)